VRHFSSLLKDYLEYEIEKFGLVGKVTATTCDSGADMKRVNENLLTFILI
jgi:hypothetical protein